MQGDIQLHYLCKTQDRISMQMSSFCICCICFFLITSLLPVDDVLLSSPVRISAYSDTELLNSVSFQIPPNTPGCSFTSTFALIGKNTKYVYCNCVIDKLSVLLTVKRAIKSNFAEGLMTPDMLGPSLLHFISLLLHMEDISGYTEGRGQVPTCTFRC